MTQPTYRAVTTPNDSPDINLHSLQLDRRTYPRVYIVMEFLDSLVTAANVKICTRDSDIVSAFGKLGNGQGIR